MKIISFSQLHQRMDISGCVPCHNQDRPWCTITLSLTAKSESPIPLIDWGRKLEHPVSLIQIPTERPGSARAFMLCEAIEPTTAPPCKVIILNPTVRGIQEQVSWVKVCILTTGTFSRTQDGLKGSTCGSRYIYINCIQNCQQLALAHASLKVWKVYGVHVFFQLLR